MRPAAGFLRCVTVEIVLLDLEFRDEIRAASRRIPVAGDLDGIVIQKHRVEDRLVGQARRKSAHAEIADER
jgi:hypothetical protein